MPLSGFDSFMKMYASEHPERVTTIDLTDVPEDALSPFIVVKYGRYAAVINPMPLTDHLCIDVHSFVDDEDARGGVFAMEYGGRIEFPESKCPGKSHGWPGAALVAVLIGEQEGPPVKHYRNDNEEDS